MVVAPRIGAISPVEARLRFCSEAVMGSRGSKSSGVRCSHMRIGDRGLARIVARRHLLGEGAIQEHHIGGNNPRPSFAAADPDRRRPQRCADCPAAPVPTGDRRRSKRAGRSSTKFSIASSIWVATFPGGCAIDQQIDVGGNGREIVGQVGDVILLGERGIGRQGLRILRRCPSSAGR